MASTGEVQQAKVGQRATTEWGFVLLDQDLLPRGSFSFASEAVARQAKENMDKALANVTHEVWP
jgi:hypothetical protein